MLMRLYRHFKICCLYYALLLVALPAMAQQIQNNSFETPDTTRAGSKNWSTFNLGYIISTDSTVAHTGKRSVKIIKKGDEFYDGFTQNISYTPEKPVKLILTGYVKTIGPNKGRAGLFIRIHNKEGTMLILNTEDKETSDNNPADEWKKHSIEIFVPDNTAKVVAGGSLSANGTVWFDDLQLQAVEVKDTAKSEVAAKYLVEAYDIIRKNALRKDSVNLPAIYNDAYKIAGPAKTTAGCYDAVIFMLNGLGDHHSSLWSPEEASSRKNENAEKGYIAFPSAVLMNDSIGYIVLPHLSSTNKKITYAYADTLQKQIRKIDSENKITAWIVDLRKNLGGSWFNMIAAIGPILGDGIAGFTVDQYGKKISWGYRQHCAFENDTCLLRITGAYDIRKANPKVAVITNGFTTSAGEVIAIGFRKKPNTRSFGQATYGVATNKFVFPLSDGAAITLAVAAFADRTGAVYSNKVIPDIIVEDDPATKQDEVLIEAVKWISHQ
jgi:C-terminal processing protease CtpA/Prc